jgi:O-antigen ligase/Flp pilus assembly protein TadD
MSEPVPRSSRSTLPRVASTVVALLVLALPQLRGAVDLWVEVIAATLALFALFLATTRSGELPRPALPLLVVLVVIAAQLLPLPVVAHRLSPGAQALFQTSLAPIGLYPAARPLSIDPAATARELAKALALLSVFCSAWSFSSGRRRRERLLVSLAASGVAVAVVVLGAALVGLNTLLAPTYPFVNPNHLAGFLNLSAFVALGLALRSHGQARAVWLLGFVTAGAVTLLSLSRGGIGAFLLGAAVFVALWVRARRVEQDGASTARHVLLAGGLAAAFGIAAYLAVDPVLTRMATLREAPSDIKVQLVRPALQVVRDFPLVGVGRGAFSVAFTAYQSESSSVTFTHVENEWIQAVADLGIPAGLLLLATFLWLWIAAAARADLSSAEIGLLGGTAALAAQNTFDFSLEVLGVAIPFAAAMGLVARGQRAFAPPRWALRAGVAVALAVAASAFAVAHEHGADRDLRRVTTAGSPDATAAAARAALRWHPADWLLHADPGVRLGAARRCGEAVPWLLRAMILDPTAPEPHLATARCLAGRNDAAAKREYRLAIAYGTNAYAEALQRYPAVRDLLEIAPGTPDGLLNLGDALAGERPADAEQVYLRLLDEFSDERALMPLAFTRFAQADPEGALAYARRHAASVPTDPAAWNVAARSLQKLGREDEARTEIERGLAAVPGSPQLVGFLVERAMAARRWSEALRLANDIAPRTPAEIAGKHLLIAQALHGQGRLGEAVERARSAAAAFPDVSWTTVALANFAAYAGRWDEAVAALRHAAALPGAPAGAYDQRIAELEAAKAAEQQRLLERRVLHGAAPASQGAR